MIEFDGSFELDRPPEELWDYFTDPDVIAECAPGVSALEQTGPSTLEAVVSVGVGSVKPTFDVDIVVTAADHPSHLEMSASGTAARNAFEGVAGLDLAEDGDGGTLAEWSATADVSGLIASMGQRALGSVTKRLVGNFFEDVEAMAEAGEPAESSLEADPDAEPAIDGE